MSCAARAFQSFGASRQLRTNPPTEKIRVSRSSVAVPYPRRLEIRRGSRLGSGAPIGRVPVTRPRRDRVMGSSILASLSEAGGNDPRGLVSKPLPPHSLDPADRVERNPRPFVMQTKGPNRLVPRKPNFVEITLVSGLAIGMTALATCRSGNRRPTAELPLTASHPVFRNTPSDTTVLIC